MDILCILAYKQSVCQKGVDNTNTRTVHTFLKNFSNDTDVTRQNVFHSRYSAITILNQNNKAYKGKNE